VFDSAAFVHDVQSAAASSDPINAVREVVAVAIVDGAAIDSVLGTEFKPEHETLFSPEDLTIQLQVIRTARHPSGPRVTGRVGLTRRRSQVRALQRPPRIAGQHRVPAVCRASVASESL
jgi:hypothetical protein